jgi:hypothetical protein
VSERSVGGAGRAGPGVSWRTGVTVTGPDGRPWVVRRRWVPRLGNDTPWQRFHRRFRSTMERGRKLSDAGDVASDFGCGIDLLEGLVVAVLLLLLLVFLLMVALPLLLALLDLLVLLLLALVGVAARVVFRRPWVVEAAHAGPPVESVLRWNVVGWRLSAERCQEIAASLQAGIVPPDGEVLAGGSG